MTQAVSILTRIHKPDILRHLVALPAEDRWLRFAHSISPAALKNYVHEIDLSRDKALGVYDPDHALIGFTHISVDQPSGCAELGISVLSEHRRRGLAELGGFEGYDEAKYLIQQEGTSEGLHYSAVAVVS